MDHVGIDVHQKYSQVCEISQGEVALRAQVPTTQASLMRHFGGRERLRIVLECGGSSRWWRGCCGSSDTRWWWSTPGGCG